MNEKRHLESGPGRLAMVVVATAALLLLSALPAAAQGSGFGKAGSSSPSATPAKEGMKPAGKSPPATSAAPARARGKTMKMSKDVEAKLDRLPPDQLVEVGGRTMTVKDIRAKEAQFRRQQNARVQARAGKFPSRLEEMSAKFESAQQAEIEKHNTKVKAEIAKIKRQGPGPAPASARSADAVKAEARAIQSRVKAGTATPQDEARARALYDEFQELE